MNWVVHWTVVITIFFRILEWSAKSISWPVGLRPTPQESSI